MKTFISHNEKETLLWGEKLGKSLNGGEIIALQGDLGAGKTKLCQGIARGLGLKKIVNSPTFVVARHYSKLIHIDTYRLEKHKDLLDIGWHDFLSSGKVILVEWPEKIKKILPPKTIWIEIESLGEEKRKITLKTQKAKNLK